MRNRNQAANYLAVGLCVTGMAMADYLPSAGAEVSHQVKVVLLRKESSLHTTISNRDVYLLRVIPQKGAAFDAVAIDSYPGYAKALPVQNLGDVTFSMRLIRTPDCDRPSGYDAQKSIRCFRIDRTGWHTPKSAIEEWWK